MKCVAYYFTAPDCSACAKLKVGMLMMAEDYPDIEWVTVNVRETKTDLVQRYGVKPLPTLVVAVKDSTGKDIYSEKCSDRTSVMPYNKIMTNGLNYSKATQ